MHLSGRLCDRRFGCASVVLDDARARANANSIEFNTAREKLLQNTFGARILVTYMLTLKSLASVVSAAQMSILDDSRACATVDFW